MGLQGFGMGAWEGGMLPRGGHSAHAWVEDLSCPGGSRGRWGACCIGLGPSFLATASLQSDGSAILNPAPATRAVGQAARCARVLGEGGQGMALVTLGKVVVARGTCCSC